MRNIKKLALAIGLCICVWALPAQAQGIWGACDAGSAGSSDICAAKDKDEATDIVKRLIEVFLFVIGALSVIMIIHSGFKYVNSRGDPESVKNAKNTLLYAVVGLIVAILSFAIVDFVVGAFRQSGNQTYQNSEPREQIT